MRLRELNLPSKRVPATKSKNKEFFFSVKASRIRIA